MIVVDGYPLLSPPGGIKSYTASLLKELSPYIKNSPTDKIVIIIPQIPEESINFFNYKQIVELESEQYSQSIQVVRIPFNTLLYKILKFFHQKPDKVRRYVLFIWECLTLPQYIHAHKPEIVFHPYQFASDYKTSTKKIIVIHDILHWINLERYTTFERYMYRSFKSGCRNCDTIITISETSKKEILDFLQPDPEKVKVCYEGIDNKFINFVADLQKAEEVKKSYALPENYMFGFIADREYKNSLGLIKVFHEVQKMTNHKNTLVLLGGTKETNHQVKEYIEANNLEKYILFIPALKKFEDLFYLYFNSYIFIFLSYQEGFGIPPLEGLLCNTLPIVSDKSSVGELYKDYLPCFDPDNHKQIADYIVQLTDEKRNTIIAESRPILKEKYSWKTILPRYMEYLHIK